jgi:hypothetical protein
MDLSSVRDITGIQFVRMAARAVVGVQRPQHARPPRTCLARALALIVAVLILRGAGGGDAEPQQVRARAVDDGERARAGRARRGAARHGAHGARARPPCSAAVPNVTRLTLRLCAARAPAVVLWLAACTREQLTTVVRACRLPVQACVCYMWTYPCSGKCALALVCAIASRHDPRRPGSCHQRAQRAAPCAEARLPFRGGAARALARLPWVVCVLLVPVGGAAPHELAAAAGED